MILISTSIALIVYHPLHRLVAHPAFHLLSSGYSLIRNHEARLDPQLLYSFLYVARRTPTKPQLFK
jgi:hypothetical protein